MAYLDPVTPQLLQLTGLKTEADLLNRSALLMIAMGASSFVGLMFMAAPYGKYFNTSAANFFGFLMNGKLAWILQELPSFAVPAWFWWKAASDPSSRYDHLRTVSPNTILLSLMLLHYFNRTFVFPMRLRGGKPTPFGIFLMALVFCLWNGYMQGLNLTRVADYSQDKTYWLEPNFLLGVFAFFFGMLVNIGSDNILMNLRKSEDDKGYYIPMGGFFHYVSAPNFFGEIVEWAGWACANWSLPAAAFAFFTFCNIGPRGAQHHKWYQQKFGDKYPRARKAVIPLLW